MNAPATDPYSIPLDKLDSSDGKLFQNQEHWEYFRRLRQEDPVHFVESDAFGPYWSTTR